MKNFILKIAFALLPILSIGQNHSLHFDGTDDHVNLGDNFGFENSDSFSVEAWIQVTSNSGFQQIISKLDNSFRGWGLQITDDGTISGFLFSTFLSNQRYVEGSTFLIDGQWHHVAMVYNADNIVLYLDGNIEPLSTDSPIGTLGTIINSSNTQIGNYHADGNSGEYFNGYIDEIRIWDEARSETEILESYDTELTGTEAGLIGYYKMDDDNATCDIADCNNNETNGDRMGSSGANNLPQFSTDIPILTDVACGASTVCLLAVETFNQNDIKLYPNPTSGEMQIIGLDSNKLTIEINDVLGKRIKKMVVSNQRINLSDLPNGFYFISLQVDNSTPIIKKVIKK